MPPDGLTRNESNVYVCGLLATPDDTHDYESETLGF